MKALKMTLTDAEQLIAGILWGAVEAEGLSNIKDCITGAEVIFHDVEDAVKDFELQTAAGTIDGIKKIGESIFDIRKEISACKGVVVDITKLAAMGAIFSNPITFAFHVGKDIVVNGV
jgi:hypothetical protein